MSTQRHVYFDGTWNDPELATNVFQLFQQVPGEARQVDATASVRAHRQRVSDAVQAFYLVGVGAGSEHNGVLEGALGLGLHRRVVDAFVLLSQHYRPGDTIWIFGFSRGAWSARALAGLVATAGLLPQSIAHSAQAQEAAEQHWQTAKQQRAQGRQLGDRFWTDCRDERPIRMVGVWDTVGALGIPFFNGLRSVDALEKQLFDFADLTLHARVDQGRHAVSVDEQRFDFSPTLWEPRDGVHQVWFPGVHADVGGGYQENGLSDIALRWMSDEAIAAGAALTPLPASLKGNPLAERHDEAGKGPWQLRPRKARKLPSQAELHPSVLTRLDGCPAYRPAALKPLGALSAFFAHAPVGQEPIVNEPWSKDWRALAAPQASKTDIWVYAHKWWNASLIQVKAGESYRVTASGSALDASVDSGPEGYASGGSWKLRLLEPSRRVSANWFRLIAAIHPDGGLEAQNPDSANTLVSGLEALSHRVSHCDDASQLVPVGADGTFTAQRDGYLYLFVNDAAFAYGNNSRRLTATVTRLT